MTLCDASALIALLHRRDRYHDRCVAAAQNAEAPLVTTWPCLVEAMYLLYRELGWQGQDALWSLLADENVVLYRISDDEMSVMRHLMQTYRDLPMDLADASLVAAAESLRTQLIFTLDSDFRIYRLSGNRAFDIIP
ncbi:MAG: PIN domain-containing protein [Cyanobacteria bacterium J06642_2]